MRQERGRRTDQVALVRTTAWMRRQASSLRFAGRSHGRQAGAYRPAAVAIANCARSDSASAESFSVACRRKQERRESSWRSAARLSTHELTSPGRTATTRRRGHDPRLVRSRLRWAYLVIPWSARQPLRPSRAVVRGRRVTADARRRKPTSARPSRRETRAARFARVTRGNLRRAGVGALLARRDRSRQRRSTTNETGTVSGACLDALAGQLGLCAVADRL